jgi:hypothetical protein
MDCASVSDLDNLDRDALVAIYLAQQQKLASLISARDEELRRLEAELESHRQTLSQQSDELHSRSERIEHLKLMVEKLRHVIFGAKSEKIVIQLGQLELQLEDEETTHAELEAAAERVARTASRCRNIFHVRSSRMLLMVTAVPIVEASYGSLETTSPNSWSTSPTASRSSDTSDLSSPAVGVTGSSKHRQPLDPSSVVWPALACWPMSSCRSLEITFRCIDSLRSMLDRMSRSHALRWLAGSAQQVIC